MSMPLFGIVSGPLADRYGMQMMSRIAAVVLPAGLIVGSFSTQVWHLILTQGLVTGIGGGFAYYSAMAVVTQYFDRKRGMAMRITAAGSGPGGLILGPAFDDNK
ncbi:hypothetical protein HDU87_000003 [Geranomyces variabilis]|uniref:Major facilitator superfamily (MFS) profile domain-containing protein n=1 Tax=Geranomyces variabilis TaxID=109894 RepID=A0AAD5TRV8_9FUNG|nr:hypothetical protein HDU87_000003 [Geranomyces variabilis]